MCKLFRIYKINKRMREINNTLRNEMTRLVRLNELKIAARRSFLNNELARLKSENSSLKSEYASLQVRYTNEKDSLEDSLMMARNDNYKLSQKVESLNSIIFCPSVGRSINSYIQEKQKFLKTLPKDSKKRKLHLRRLNEVIQTKQKLKNITKKG